LQRHDAGGISSESCGHDADWLACKVIFECIDLLVLIKVKEMSSKTVAVLDD
jgi:hypothetical protein